MCIGVPMTVLTARPGFALAAGRGAQREVSTALVGDVAVGDWVLVFLDSVREVISAERAHEVDATLDLLQAAVDGTCGGALAAIHFPLPSAMSVAELSAITESR